MNNPNNWPGDDKYEAEAIGNPFGEQPEDDAAPIERFPALRYIGQLHNTFLLAEGEDGFYILDQHAAQERIKYEYYREKNW